MLYSRVAIKTKENRGESRETSHDGRFSSGSPSFSLRIAAC